MPASRGTPNPTPTPTAVVGPESRPDGAALNSAMVELVVTAEVVEVASELVETDDVLFELCTSSAGSILK